MEELKFNIKCTFQMTSRKTFVIIGNGETGDLNRKRFLHVADKMINIPISSIEAVDFSDSPSMPGLLINYKDYDQLNILRTLKEGDFIFLSDERV